MHTIDIAITRPSTPPPPGIRVYKLRLQPPEEMPASGMSLPGLFVRPHAMSDCPTFGVSMILDQERKGQAIVLCRMPEY
eukprot:6492458-Amphidinium_carterae.3